MDVSDKNLKRSPQQGFSGNTTLKNKSYSEVMLTSLTHSAVQNNYNLKSNMPMALKR